MIEVRKRDAKVAALRTIKAINNDRKYVKNRAVKKRLAKALTIRKFMPWLSKPRRSDIERELEGSWTSADWDFLYGWQYAVAMNVLKSCEVTSSEYITLSLKEINALHFKSNNH